MSLQISLPFGNKSNVKSLVFSILAREYPLKIIEIKNLILKRYGKSVSFQAVRKAMLELVNDGILLKKDNSFVVNKQWVFDSKKVLDELYSTIYLENVKPISVSSVGEELSVFSFNSIAEMMKFWENLIDDWFSNIDTKSLKLNCWQGAHSWEALLFPETEQKVMSQLKKKGVKSYILTTGNTELDKFVLKFYRDLGIKFFRAPSSSFFDKEYYVATYGDLVVQTRYPKEIVEEMELFFKKTKNLQGLDLKKLSEIVNKKVNIQLSVSRNSNMAKQINQSIMSQMN